MHRPLRSSRRAREGSIWVDDLQGNLCELCDSAVNQTEMDLNQLSSEVIGAAIEVHRILGPGLLESTYEECLCHELRLEHLNYDRQVGLPVSYKGNYLDCGYRIDILVEKSIILELKSVDTILGIHKAQLLTYLKLADIHLGLLMNFNVPLMRDGIHRIVNNFV
ncbi:conserved hypothetical protein [Desulfosarcina cetonica]|nr:conserved hypothetical protein [Desulfosarcina cetonica]